MRDGRSGTITPVFLVDYVLPYALVTGSFVLVARQKYRNFMPLSWRATIPLVLTTEAAITVTGILVVRVVPNPTSHVLITSVIWLIFLIFTFYVLCRLTRFVAPALYLEYAAFFRQWLHALKSRAFNYLE